MFVYAFESIVSICKYQLSTDHRTIQQRNIFDKASFCTLQSHMPCLLYLHHNIACKWYLKYINVVLSFIVPLVYYLVLRCGAWGEHGSARLQHVINKNVFYLFQMSYGKSLMLCMTWMVMITHGKKVLYFGSILRG